MDDIKVYHRPAGQRRVLHARWLAFYLAVIGGLGLAMAAGLWRAGATNASSWELMLIVLVAIGAAQTLAVRTLVRRLMTYQLTLGPNVLRIVQDGIVPTEVLRQNVTRLVETSRGLRIYVGRTAVGVPRDVGGYDEVRARLGTWATIERSRLGNLWLTILVGQLALWALSVYLPMAAPALTAVLGLFVAGAIALTVFVARSVVAKRDKGRLYAVELVLVVWCAVRIYLAWSAR
jgi:hypothetical protein